MAQQAQSIPFVQSYERFYTYPQNLIYKPTYRGVLKAYDMRLETAEPPFLTHDEREVKVHFRDWNHDERRFLNHQAINEDELRKQLGEHSHVEPSTADVERFLYGESSTEPLKITPRMLKRLFTYYQVMPAMVDFLSVFAQRLPEKRELGFSGFFDQVTLSRSTAAHVTGPSQQVTANSRQHLAARPGGPYGPAVSALGCSERQYQMCYNLKRVARTRGDAKSEVDDQTWSIQQNEFHHQFDVSEGTALWISAKGRVKDYRQEVLELTGGTAGVPEDLSFDSREHRFASSLTVHLMNCHWASQDWRDYVKYLEDAIEQKSGHILVNKWISNDSSPESLQDVQFFEEKATNAAMVLDANIEVMTSLRNFYVKLLENNDFDMRDQCADTVDLFKQQITDMMHTFTGYKRRLQLLTDVTENRKNLLLQKLQSHATKKMEDLTTMSYRETIVMKVITVGTFVYLPATFVSVSIAQYSYEALLIEARKTFFSTDIVKYQSSPDGKAMYSGLALERWLEITVPLTVITVIMGLIAFIIADRRRIRRLAPSYDEKKGA
ncbi:uncharacterized protein N0V89_004799 [Didymosphaeria variabile]|uniref:CorA-like transporter domain-containing protein n=1 Tax=Didymosphaeria variabile TaxID=1932322 RepID=A0A9W8XSW2_9PLEO|nr:uncharacterized protein N0V89_004799 [Didymosphaeria variabile]KAJ4356763.1 hypothetical protein N0V89_004799 [Didymosphaeria variabile]